MLRVSGFDGRVDVRTSSKTWAQELGIRQVSLSKRFGSWHKKP